MSYCFWHQPWLATPTFDNAIVYLMAWSIARKSHAKILKKHSEVFGHISCRQQPRNGTYETWATCGRRFFSQNMGAMVTSPILMDTPFRLWVHKIGQTPAMRTKNGYFLLMWLMLPRPPICAHGCPFLQMRWLFARLNAGSPWVQILPSVFNLKYQD